MAGLRISHDIDELEVGTELVLKDTSVLDESDDTLTNSRLKDQFRASRIQAAKKAHHSVHEYTGEEKHALLPQYDDPEEEQNQRGFIIGEDGEFKAPLAVAHLGTGENLNTQVTLGKEFTLPKRTKRRRAVEKPTKVSRTEMQDVYSQRRLAAQSVKVIEEEDDEVARSLSRTLLMRRKAEVESDPPGHTDKGSFPTKQPNQAPPETLEGVEFSDALEFLQNVQVAPRDLTHLASGALSVRDAVGGTTSVLNVALPSERVRFEAGVKTIAANTNSSTEDVKKRLATGEGAQTEVKVEAADVQFTEPVLGRGLAAVLGLIRDRGYFNDKKLFGRQRDTPVDDDYIEYRDEKGRLLTKKQAYRLQCYSFHNKQPGKKKLERLAVREKAKDVQAMTGPSSFKAQKAIMSRVKAPYVVAPSSTLK